MTDFQPFPKIPRLKRTVIITEKIDGTNAQVFISDDLSEIKAGSRSRWITPDNDNYGFARWVEESRDELLKLGPGRHYGEWWGQGIQRRYGLSEKRFSLFNTSRWAAETLPACCSVVPVLYVGEDLTGGVNQSLERLASEGSVAAPGFQDPEGIVVYHTASREMYKVTLKNDEKPKGQGQ